MGKYDSWSLPIAKCDSNEILKLKDNKILQVQFETYTRNESFRFFEIIFPS